MDSGICETSHSNSFGLRDPEPTPHSGVHKRSTQNRGAAIRRFLVFAIAYGVAQKYGSGFSEKMPPPLWFPDSVQLCALLVVPKRQWLWYLLGPLPIRIMFSNAPAW